MLGKIAVAYLLVGSACQHSLPDGKLLVTAPYAATFAIFRIVGMPPHLIAERTATFNTPIAIAPARYLLLSDCSHTFVTIKAATTIRRQAYHLVFTPPHRTISTGAFSVQCQRFAASQQHLHNKFSLLLLTPQQKLLVGSAPLNVDFNNAPHRQFALAALQVAPTAHNMRFFVYPRHSQLSVTNSQRSGHWLYLLPGEYVVEFNGARTTINLQHREEKVIHPAILYISAPQPASHLTARINDNHLVPFNEPLPLPASAIALRLMPNSQPLPLTLQHGRRTVVKARRLQVIPTCDRSTLCTAPTISLYRQQATTPFLTTSAPTVFFHGSTVQLSIASTPHLTRRLPAHQRQLTLPLGKLILRLRSIYSANQFSDLLRIEAAASPLQGHSNDLSLTTTTELQLLPGRYRLTHFVSSTQRNVSRRRFSRIFTIHPQRTHHLDVRVFKRKQIATK